MCRLFGFRSVIPSQVHYSLLRADNALCKQSEYHSDGWGVAYWVDGAPQVTKAANAAIHDKIFNRVSGVVSSETVIAHVRKATQGDLTVLNTHPFQHGRWVFAHNGDIPDFSEVRDALRAEISPRLSRFVLGDTDSEIVFFIFLSQLHRHGPLASNFGVDEVMAALRATVRRVREICDTGSRGRALLTIIVSNGATLVATRGGKELFWSSYKAVCSERDTCPNYGPECMAPTETGFVKHLLFSSEPLGGENVWIELEEDEMVGVDWRMRLVQRNLHERVPLPVAP